MANEIKGGGQSQVFDYKQVDGQTADFLRRKESNMREIVGKAYTELGRELKEAQTELAKQGSKYEGVFEKWYTYLGWKKRTVYNLIDRFDLVLNLHEVSEIERIEDLPVSLTYEIAKPSAESSPEKAQAKSEVLAGNIDTLKEYRDRIAELEGRAKQAERQADIERSQRLKHVKENDLAHGEWTEFCKSVRMDVRQANKFIRVVDELSGKWSTSTTLGMEALYQIATLPPEQREAEHLPPSYT
ncbi:hypothetical protein J2Z23_000194 [Lederbergia galactosidilyticus]|uniref:hypothetical protein n=1 Tax=Lederbergia galactosidilytica TaxID=217031 RepID=UPI001D34DCDF|nr:hypothetical protein [Lederbergia galactosidilytica]MBP1913262.1 hypothetical protein [Lederbergia galactosidilytica]